MVEVLKQQEVPPAAYPAVPDGLSVRALALDANALWQRIEAYTAHRFSEREVVWVIEASEGADWCPSLTPIASHVAEKWEGGAWVAVTMPNGPLGLCVPSDGQFRVTAQVGVGPVPKAVSEAFRRLAEYSVEISTDGMVGGHAAHQSHDVNIAGEMQESFARSQTWAAKALQLSGAADLLRPYRRA